MKKIIMFVSLISSSLSLASTEEICKNAGVKAANQPVVIQACATLIAERLAIVSVDLNRFYEGLKAKYEECMENNGRCTEYKIRVTSKDESGKETPRFVPVDLTKWQEQKEKANQGLQQAAQLANQQCLNAVSLKGAEECTDQLKGYQDFTNTLVNLSTFFMSSILPNQMTHVDIGDILTGKPLGGDGAVVVEIREALLNMTGTPDFIADYVRNPVNVSQNVIRELIKGAGDFMNNLCGDVCGGLNVRF